MKNLFHRIAAEAKLQLLVFVLLLVAVELLMGYASIVFMGPRGIHYIRQTDSLSFITHYVKTGMHFFEPGVMSWNTSFRGRAACEFPVIYYLIAGIYHYTGEQEFFLRLVNLLLVSTGLVFLFKTIRNLLNDYQHALILVFLFFSSGVLLFYACNFLPDAAALGLTLTGWGLFMRYAATGGRKLLVFSFFFFTLASLIKVTYLVSPLTVISLFTLEMLGLRIHNARVFTNRILTISLSLLTLLPVVAWNLFVIAYNSKNADNYFLRDIRPVWEMTPYARQEVIDVMRTFWARDYYYPYALYFLGILAVCGIIFFRHTQRLLALLTLIICAGTGAYFILFFGQFTHHDYYIITMLPALFFAVINGLCALVSRFPALFRGFVFKLVLLACCIMSLQHGRGILKGRYTNTESQPIGKISYILEGVREKIDSLGISGDDSFIVLADHSPNGSLYEINRLGWALKEPGEWEQNRIAEVIGRREPDYFLFTDTLPEYNSLVEKYSCTKVLNHHNVSIYKIGYK